MENKSPKRIILGNNKHIILRKVPCAGDNQVEIKAYKRTIRDKMMKYTPRTRYKHQNDYSVSSSVEKDIYRQGEYKPMEYQEIVDKATANYKLKRDLLKPGGNIYTDLKEMQVTQKSDMNHKSPIRIRTQLTDNEKL